MDAKIKAKWVKALRSGKYKQCARRLHDGGSFCCLGLLLHVTNDSPQWRKRTDATTWKDMGESLVIHPLTSPEQCYWRADDMLGGESLRRELTEINDGGDSFGAIADWIEANL